MNSRHFSHHALLIDDELLRRNDSFVRISSIIQNLSYHSDEYDSCLRNMLFTTMFDACLSDLFSLLRKICLAYHKTLTCSCTCSEYNL